MDLDQRVVRRCQLRAIRRQRQPRLLLVDGDLGRRTTLTIALAARYVVATGATAAEALARAAASPFDVAVLDAGTIGGALPRAMRVLRGRSRDVRVVVVAGRRDFRARNFSATLRAAAVLDRPVATHRLLARVAALASPDGRAVRTDRCVGRAIDLIAGDVTHLRDVTALAGTIGVPLPRLAECFRAATGLTIREYVAHVRVAVAERLLQDTSLGVGTLVDLLGFASTDELALVFGTRAHRRPAVAIVPSPR